MQLELCYAIDSSLVEERDLRISFVTDQCRAMLYHLIKVEDQRNEVFVLWVMPTYKE